MSEPNVPTTVPQRVHNPQLARQKYGALADRLFDALQRTDPLADAVVEDFAHLPRAEGWAAFDKALRQGIDAVASPPPSLVALFAAIDRVPAWVDWDRIARGGELLFRGGLPGGIVLGAKSLCYGYCAPAGNKPLAFTGQLSGPSVGRRLAETGRFVVATCEPGGLSRFADGFQATIRVRLMHAQVRRLLRHSSRWDHALWAEPINQHDMLATSLLFSHTFLEGLRQFGFTFTEREADDYVHLWRYSSWLMGVEDPLLPDREREAEQMAHAILDTQGPPDDDSRRLVAALLNSPRATDMNRGQDKRTERAVAIAHGFCRSLLGDQLADELELRRDHWRLLIPAVSLVVGSLEPIRRNVPVAERVYQELGRRYWAFNLKVTLGKKPARFAPPQGLGGLRPRA
ncbi:MAG: oxygenase MpaB family protein, partial [Myxococcota bacterium]